MQLTAAQSGRTNAANGLQICIFLKLDTELLCEGLYVCALRCGSHPPRLSAGTATTRCSCLPAAARVEQSSAQMLDLLSAKPDVAEVVLTAPSAHESSSPLQLAQLYSSLPSELHAVAARGFFGTNTVKWPLDLSGVVAALASERTAEVLSGLPRVTAVCLSGDTLNEQVLRRLAHATHISAITFDAVNDNEAGVFSAASLQLLTPLHGLQSLELSGARIAGCNLPGLVPALTQLCRLTALLLSGRRSGNATDDAAGVAAFAPALTALSALVRFGLPHMHIGCVGAAALGPVLAGLSRLRTLDLNETGVMKDSAIMATGVAACTRLEKLESSGCCLTGQNGSLSALCGTAARLGSLNVGSNHQLGNTCVRQLLAAPALLGLTDLRLGNVGLFHQSQSAEAEGLWLQLCKLTALQVLSLDCNWLGDAGACALARHIGRLAQLSILSIAWCKITAAGAVTLGSQIFSLPHLKGLRCKQDVVKVGVHVWDWDEVQPFVVPNAAIARGLEVRWLEA